MSHCGFSLLELLIAIFMAALLTTGAMEIYLNLKKNYRVYQMQVQQDAEMRLAMLRINHWIRLAGYQGCNNKEVPVNVVEAIRGYSANLLPKNYDIRAKPDTDVLLLGECEYYQGHWQFLHLAIYIGKTRRKDREGKSIYALYDKKIPGKSEELAPSITSLKVLYGLKGLLHSDVIAYQKSDEVKDWSSIISVEYHLNNANGYVALREPL